MSEYFIQLDSTLIGIDGRNAPKIFCLFSRFLEPEKNQIIHMKDEGNVFFFVFIEET